MNIPLSSEHPNEKKRKEKTFERDCYYKPEEILEPNARQLSCEVIEASIFCRVIEAPIFCDMIEAT